jgi:glutathione synthase/RimK-type ligase-like ATP-grasp enzyme
MSASTILWVNNPISTAVSNLKIRNLAVAAKLGFRIPKTIVTNVPEEAHSFLDSVAPARLIYKPLTYYYEEGGIAVFTTAVCSEKLHERERNIHAAPIMLQELVEKEYEIRATVLGVEVHAVRINSQIDADTALDWRRDQLRTDMYEIIELSDQDSRRIVELQREFGLAYGAYDFIVDKSEELIFLEVNPSGQWLWLEHATSIPISRAVATLLASKTAHSKTVRK